MSRVTRGISLVFYFLIYFMNFSLARSSGSRFGFRVVRETKMEKLQSVDENEFHDIGSSEAELRDKRVCRGKSKRGSNYEVNGPKRGRKLFARNKVAPMERVREKAWTRSSENKRTRNMESECGYNNLRVPDEAGRATRKRSFQHWNTKTGKEIIKTEEKQSQPSFSSGNHLTSFLNDLTPPSAVNFITCQPNGLPCDVSIVEETADVVPSLSSGAFSHVTFSFKRGQAWAEEVKRGGKKSALNTFFSRFKRGETTKVKKLRF